MSALTDLFTAFANKIRSKTGGSDTYTPPQMVNAIDDVYQAGVNAGTTPTQTKTVTAGTSATTVTPDTGYALSSVTVNPTPSQSKSATPTTTAQTITPDSGKLLSSVSVGAIQTETKSDTPNVSTNKTVSPSSGKYLSQVTIQPLTHSGTYTPAANTAQNDMGAYHDKRYVNTSGMIVPSGAKSITANGTGIDVSSYATANVNVPNPTLSGNATPADVKSGKTYYGSNYTKQTGIYVEPTIYPITPSNSSPATMQSGSNYVPITDGYAIEYYGNIVPSSSPQRVLAGEMLHIDSYDGYLISGYRSVMPSEDGAYFYSGMNYMGASGYAYSQKPTPSISKTTLWTNSSPSSSFSSKDVTLSQDIDNFDYIEIVGKEWTNQPSTIGYIFSVEDVKNATSAQNIMTMGLVCYAQAYAYARRIYYKSGTVIHINNASRVNSESTNNSALIPLYVNGLKLSLS